MLEQMAEEEVKSVDATQVYLLLKSIASKFIQKDIYIMSQYKENNHLSTLG